MDDCILVDNGLCDGCCYQCEREDVAERLLEEEDDDDKVYTYLKSLGFEEAAELVKEGCPETVRPESTFICSTLGNTRICSPCQLLGCKFWIDYEYGYNCLLAYMHQKNVDALTVEEMSFLFRIPLEEIREVLSGAVQKMRDSVPQEEKVCYSDEEEEPTEYEETIIQLTFDYGEDVRIKHNTISIDYGTETATKYEQLELLNFVQEEMEFI